MNWSRTTLGATVKNKQERTNKGRIACSLLFFRLVVVASPFFLFFPPTLQKNADAAFFFFVSTSTTKNRIKSNNNEKNAQIAPCPRSDRHDPQSCPFAHENEKAARRDPRGPPAP